MVRRRGPDLLAVDDVIVALALGRGLQRRKVGAGARLGKALAPPVVDIGGARQKPLLLLLRAELDQHRADHRDIERVDLRRRRRLVLFEKNHALHRRPAGSAPFLGPVDRRPSRVR